MSDLWLTPDQATGDPMERVQLECGCRTWCEVDPSGENVMKYAPCSIDCRSFREALKMAREEEVPVRYKTL